MHVLYNFQAVASKLHGVDVDIKIIKRKGDPLYPIDDNIIIKDNNNSRKEKSLHHQENKNSDDATATVENGNNNNNVSECPNEFMSSNNQNGLNSSSSDGTCSKLNCIFYFYSLSCGIVRLTQMFNVYIFT